MDSSVGFLFLILMFFSVFCLSGRGIQIIQGVLEKGIKKITISWRGIIIECEEDESNLQNVTFQRSFDAFILSIHIRLSCAISKGNISRSSSVQ